MGYGVYLQDSQYAHLLTRAREHGLKQPYELMDARDNQETSFSFRPLCVIHLAKGPDEQGSEELAA